MPQVQPEQAGKGLQVSVVIRRTGYSWTWICKVPVKNKDGKMEPCNHTEVVADKGEASPEYEKHKKGKHQ